MQSAPLAFPHPGLCYQPLVYIGSGHMEHKATLPDRDRAQALGCRLKQAPWAFISR